MGRGLVPPSRILTIGHSTRSLDEFTELLTHHGVGLLVDVRTMPASRRMPHSSKLALHRSLVSDALTIRGVEVSHVISGSKPAPHALTPLAQVQGGRIIYPPADTLAI